jgi:hypothetical protein
VGVADTLADGWRHWVLFDKLREESGISRSSD